MNTPAAMSQQAIRKRVKIAGAEANATIEDSSMPIIPSSCFVSLSRRFGTAARRMVKLSELLAKTRLNQSKLRGLSKQSGNASEMLQLNVGATSACASSVHT